MAAHPDAFKPVSNITSSGAAIALLSAILGFLEMFPDTQVGTRDLFFPLSAQWVVCVCVCVEVQSLIDPVVKA